MEILRRGCTDEKKKKKKNVITRRPFSPSAEASCEVIVLVFLNIYGTVACIVTSQWILARSWRNNSSLLKNTDEGSFNTISNTYSVKSAYEERCEILSRLSENLRARHETRNVKYELARINQYQET